MFYLIIAGIYLFLEGTKQAGTSFIPWNGALFPVSTSHVQAGDCCNYMRDRFHASFTV